MKTIEKSTYKKLVSSCIVLAMILTGFATMFMVGPVETVKATNPDTTPPSIRVYGEEDAVYPTHSYYDDNPLAKDFTYTDEKQVFNPGVIRKDSLTFNPSLYNHLVHDVSTNLNEKIFLRAFYEPGYGHNPDEKMENTGYYNGDSCQFDSIVTETSYMFVTTTENREPYAAQEGLCNKATTFLLPYETTEDQPGLNVLDTNNPVTLECAVPDYDTNKETRGRILVTKQFEIDLNHDQTFFDHNIKYTGYDSAHDKYNVKVTYTGNDPDKEPNSIFFDGGLEYGYEPGNPDDADNFYFFNRHCVKRETDDKYTDTINWCNVYSDEHNWPAYRWYVHIESVYNDYDTIEVTLGRWLVAGETFYVDSVRYDLPAVYVEDGPNVNDDRFKFITLQTPIPKYDGDGWEYETTHVDTQWLEELPCGPNNPVWLLPPFNTNHIMIDDIGLNRDNLCDHIDCYKKGLKLQNNVGELEFYWKEEAIEPRFNSSLVERLYSNPTGSIECWDWYGINTMPNQYTSFVLPNQEHESQPYDESCIPSQVKTDGNEYLLTSSFIAPNTEEYVGSDSCVNRHDIIDISKEIFKNGARGGPNTVYNYYYEKPRLTFEHDAKNGKDIYLNEEDSSLRIYGQDGDEYPTHTKYKSRGYANDYHYDDEYKVFNPSVIPKDSVTFNPAFWDEYELHDEFHDLKEKIFLRMFYQPGYSHEPDQKMADEGYMNGNSCDFNAIVTETTYMYVSAQERNPMGGVESFDKFGKNTFILPYDTTEDQPGLNVVDFDNNPYVNILYAFPDRVDGELTNGEIIVDKLFTLNKNDEPVNFFDHAVEFIGYDSVHDKYKLKVTYTGNDPDKEPDSIFFKGGLEYGYPDDPDEPENYYFFNRHCAIKETDAHWPSIDNPAYRWYLHIESTGTNSIDVTLGRRLVAGETFYVDSVRYDMPAIYVSEGSSQEINDDRFKFITLQTPIPKYDGDGWEYETTHVDTQWLEELRSGPNNPVWLLPPYNNHHTMIDDIDISKSDLCDKSVDHLYKKGIKLDDKVSPLEFHWIFETFEPRFKSSLVERLYSERISEFDWDEWWEWYGVNTMPNHYTSFYFPDQENMASRYDEDWLDCTVYPDGNEYLVTTSYISPNTEKYVGDGVYCEYQHDIYNNPSMYYEPRVAFEFDAANFNGLYINQESQDPNHDPNAVNDPADGCYEVYCEGCEPCDDGITCDPIYIAIADLLANDNDQDGDEISFTGLTSSGQDYGTAEVIGNEIKYTPNGEDCDVNDYFEYQIQDMHGATDTAHVHICIQCPSDPIAKCSYEDPGCINTDIEFDASNSEGNIEWYYWNWDNSGDWDERTSEPTNTHAWSATGDKTFSLTVETYGGAKDDVVKSIEIIDCNCHNLYVNDITIESDETKTVYVDIADADVDGVRVKLMWDDEVINHVSHSLNEPAWYLLNPGQITYGDGYLEVEAIGNDAYTGYQNIIEIEFEAAPEANDGDHTVLDIIEAESCVNIDHVDHCVDDNGDGEATIGEPEIIKGDVYTCNDPDDDDGLDWDDIIQMAEAIYEWDDGELTEDEMPDDVDDDCKSLLFERYDTWEEGDGDGVVNWDDLIELADWVYS